MDIAHYKTYFITWIWLLVLTALALGIGYTSIHHTVKTFLLVGTTLAKILVIAAVFMHLRYERINLVLMTFVPIVLAVILVALTFPETLGDASHVVRVR